MMDDPRIRQKEIEQEGALVEPDVTSVEASPAQEPITEAVGHDERRPTDTELLDLILSARKLTREADVSEVYGTAQAVVSVVDAAERLREVRERPF